MTSAERPAFYVDPMIGRVIQGRYRVETHLGTGGMGAVYLARQLPLGRAVALKVVRVSTHKRDDSFASRFSKEAAAVAQLAHPNTVILHDYGQSEDGLYFIAFELLEGEPLSRRLMRGPLPVAEALHVATQIAASLGDAHEHELVHRDVKPANIMLISRGGDPLFVKVVDFGLVKMVDASLEAALTQAGTILGSPHYMSPEQVKGPATDARSDIYSFGVVLYQMLTGQPPFDEESPFAIMHAHVDRPVLPLGQMYPACVAGPQLEALVMRCLAKDPGDRYQTMDEVLWALQACHREAAAQGEVLPRRKSPIASLSAALSAPSPNPDDETEVVPNDHEIFALMARDRRVVDDPGAATPRETPVYAKTVILDTDDEATDPHPPLPSVPHYEKTVMLEADTRPTSSAPPPLARSLDYEKTVILPDGRSAPKAPPRLSVPASPPAPRKRRRALSVALSLTALLAVGGVTALAAWQLGAIEIERGLDGVSASLRQPPPAAAETTARATREVTEPGTPTAATPTLAGERSATEAAPSPEESEPDAAETDVLAPVPPVPVTVDQADDAQTDDAQPATTPAHARIARRRAAARRARLRRLRAVRPPRRVPPMTPATPDLDDPWSN